MRICSSNCGLTTALVMTFALLFTAGCGSESRGRRERAQRLYWAPVAGDAEEFLSTTGLMKIEFRSTLPMRATSRANGGPVALATTPPSTHQVVFQGGQFASDLAAVRTSGEVFCAVATEYRRAVTRPFFQPLPDGGLTGSANALVLGTVQRGSVADADAGRTLVYRSVTLTSRVHGLSGHTVLYCGRYVDAAAAAAAGITNEAVQRAFGAKARLLVTRAR